MLTYIKNDTLTPLDFDKYYICHEWDGSEDYVGFTIPLNHPQAQDLVLRLQLTETETGQTYRIHAIDQGAQTINIKAKLDLETLQKDLVPSWKCSSLTPAAAYSRAAQAAGWTVVDKSGITTRRTETFENMTILDIFKKLAKKWPGITFRLDNKTKQLTLRYPANETETLAFFSDEVNMVKRPQKKGKTERFATIMFPEGKDGLTIESVNSGKRFITDYSYSTEQICVYWKDERYTDPQSLKDDAVAKLHQMAVPSESYELAVVDLAKLKPTDFSYMAVDVLDKVKVTDRQNKQTTIHNVARYTYYPFYPALNVITLSTTPGSISKQQAITTAELQSYSSDFNEQQRAVISAISEQMKATDVMDASVIFHTNSQGKIYELIIIDTDSLETAREVWLWNKAGLAHSSTGYNGTYTTAITADGKIVADFILTGTLKAIDIEGVNISGSTIQGSTIKATSVSTTGLTWESGGSAMANAMPLATAISGTTYKGVKYSGGALEIDISGGMQVLAGGATASYSQVKEIIFKSGNNSIRLNPDGIGIYIGGSGYPKCRWQNVSGVPCLVGSNS